MAALSPRVRATIASLSHISFSARVIAERLTANQQQTSQSANTTVDADVAELKAQVIQLNVLVDKLRAEAEDLDMPDAVFTDEESAAFIMGFKPTVQELTPNVVLSVYNDRYMMDYPKNIRVLICTVLVNNFISRNLTPDPLWNSILANNGSMK